MVAGDILHSSVNNKGFKSPEGRKEWLGTRVIASIVLNRGVEFHLADVMDRS